jgi:hypothetical protein
VLVLCDGHPSDELAALGAAARLRPVPIDGYFVGSDTDRYALDFMRRLSEAGGPGGRWGKFNLGDHYRLGTELLLAITDQRDKP